MRVISLILIALATSLSFGIANADESRDMEVIVVTTARPDTLETRQVIAVENPAPTIDFSKLSIEAPTLDWSKVRLEPARIDVALQTDIESKS